MHPVTGGIAETAARVSRDPAWAPPTDGDPLPLDGLRLLPPVDPPGAVRDFYAFERHVATARRGRGLEMDPAWYDRPVFYFSNPAVLLGPGDEVTPPARTAQLDFELELGWIVGEDVRGPDLHTAHRAIAGYTVMNDWSARDVQRQEMALGLGPAKGKDFATSLGPVLVTADEFDPVRPAAMRAWVNGRRYSDADLGELHWSPAEMTAYAAESTLVRAGDVFGSGTCGTGCILELSLTHGDAYPWLATGDVVELEIEGIGRLTNTVGAAAGAAWASDPANRGLSPRPSDR